MSLPVVAPPIGPLFVPASGSGVNASCSHRAPASCPDCDGTNDELELDYLTGDAA